MIKSARLIRVSDTADTGRNKPIRGGIKAVTDQYHDAYIKPSGWQELTHMSVTREYIAICVAGMLNLPVCEPFWVNCPDQLADFRPIAGEKTLGACAWPAFATAYAGPQWRNWLRTDNLSPESTGIALSILAFDAFLDNPDRRSANPNLLVRGKDFRLIDHELAFAFTDLIMPPIPPWTQNGLDWMTHGDRQHILYPALRDCIIIDMSAVRHSWLGLKNAELDVIVSQLPATFNSVITRANRAIQRVKDVRDNIDGCITELERILS